MRARVLIINHTVLMGGAEVGLAEWMGALDLSRVDPAAVLPAEGPLAARLRDRGQRVLIQRMTRFKRPRHPMGLLGTLLRIRRESRDLARLAERENAALLHANSHSAQLLAGPAAARLGRPCIWHVRDLVSLGAAGRLMSARATRIVAVSAAAARPWRERGAAAGRVRVIHNGIDTRLFRCFPERRAARRSLFEAETDRDVIVGMVANLAPWKRHDLFLEAAARAAAAPEGGNLRFVVVGADVFGDHPGYAESLRRRIDGGGLTGRARLAGYREDMPAVMGALDILAHPADREPFGRVIVEAMAAGLPVVAAGAGGPAEIVEDGVTGILTPPGDAAAMSASILRLARNPEERKRYGEAGRRHARSRFDVRRVGVELSDLYLETLACAAG